jgi:hypothetical protein
VEALEIQSIVQLDVQTVGLEISIATEHVKTLHAAGTLETVTLESCIRKFMELL